MSVERAAFAAIKSAVEATTVGTETPVCYRVDENFTDRSSPAVVVTIAAESLDGTDNQYRVQAQLDCNVDRENAFGVGDAPENAGRLDNLLTAVLGAVVNQTITHTGWSFGKPTLNTVNVASSSIQDGAARSLTVTFAASEAGTNLPMSGADGSVEGFSGTVTAWVVEPAASLTQELTAKSRRYGEWTMTDNSARGYVDLLVDSNGTLTGEHPGTVTAATFTSGNGVSISANVLIQNYRWEGTKIGGTPQRCRVFFVINDETCAFLTGSL